jgi:hypothetical protein
MLMLQPEVVLAAVENSERLSQLKRHLCRPLDRPTIATAKDAGEVEDGDDVGNEDDPPEYQ